jgi:ribonucleoside-diphosphate reductase alpha chain
LYKDEIPKWDVSKVRPAGSPLKTFGGRASGAAPLVELFEFVISVFKEAKGNRLNSLQCHDIMCKIGEVVVVGGVRRSAMISLSNLSDRRMQSAKMGAWWEKAGHRALANNSICYTEKPDVNAFMKEWLALYESKSGERGIFNRIASEKQVASLGRRETGHAWGTNPCSEIILRPQQFCNLSEVVVRADDDLESLLRKVKLATILGTFQSTLTKLPYLRKVWTKNTEEERLLGVSLTGIMDNKMMSTDNLNLKINLKVLRENAVRNNKIMAKELGIPQSTSITCVKPSGTVSQLVDSASGIHTRHSPYYIRRVRGDINDPLTKFLIEKGVENEPCVMRPHNTVIFSFPKKAPKGCPTRKNLTAIKHLELWKIYQESWCEHKPSITVSVLEDEWPEVGAFVWKNFDAISGISFLPEDGGSYKQAPYEEISKEQYEIMIGKSIESIDWSQMREISDTTEGAQTLACVSGVCEI